MNPIYEQIAYWRDANITHEEISLKVGCGRSKVIYVLMELHTTIPFWREIIKEVNKKGGIAC